MQFHRTPLAAALLAMGMASAPAQDAAAQKRIAEIQGKMQRGETPTAEDRAFMQQVQAQQRERYVKEHPPRESTGMVPLTDLGHGSYKGEEGGLYPGGANVPPPAHARAGLDAAGRVVPLDAEGRSAPDGRIVMISTGMSNTTMESQAFQKMLGEAGGIHPRFVFVDCAQGGQTARITADPGARYWSVAEDRLRAAGVTAKQVQVTWLKQANAGPTAPFPEEARKLQADLGATLRNLRGRYPNLKIAYISNRIYAGYAATGLNPEPHAYESAFAVRWLIADQIAGKGEAGSPWLAWGPYLWADGVKARSDGLTWTPADLGPDGTHPSDAGRIKVAKLLLDFLRREPTAKPWFLAEP